MKENNKELISKYGPNEAFDIADSEGMLTYWDYIKVDELLSLQQPKTDFPDEYIFVTYHQISELYFKLMLQEMRQLAEKKDADRYFFLSKIDRLNRYAEQLASSMEIMTDGLDHKQFLEFRTALYPASGFQSAQFRKIELNITNLRSLVAVAKRDDLSEDLSDELLFENIYWKQGATENGTGKKSVTLIHFEQKYNDELILEYQNAKERNVYQMFLSNPAAYKHTEIIEALKEFDFLINIRWKLAHYKSAAKHLSGDANGQEKDSTGGTNWKVFLPPRFQKTVFFPSLWSEEELSEWGKRWVVDLMS